MRKILDERVGRQSSGRFESQGPDRRRTELTPIQRIALGVARTYPVFPCDPVSKRPLTKQGFQDATTEAGTVERWWRKYPEALIGVPTGRTSGLIAVDCDPKGLKWLEQEKRRLGDYRLHQTRRGKHLVYRMNGQAIPNSAGKLAQGVDVRGEGGYIIWWPAHGGVALGTPGDLPHWVERKLTAPKQANGGLDSNDAEPDDSRDTRKFSEGERNAALSERAFYYRKMGMSTQEIGKALLQYDLEHCEPPYQHTDGKHKVLYIARKKNRVLSDEETARIKASEKPALRTMEEIDEESVDWLWKGFLARNKVHVIAGAGATMKSTLTLAMAATVTTGGRWPDGERCPKGNVILWTGEDDLGDTVKPRFRWAGGDQSRCHVLDGVTGKEGTRPFDPGQDLALLDQACSTVGEVALIIIDPIVVIVQKDNNSVSDVRRALFPLQKMAEKHNCVILGIQHFNKGSKGKDPVERITGSGAWSQAPRIVLATAPIVDGDGNDPTSYVFACTKTFAKKHGGGFEYTFEEEPETEIARIKWGKKLEGTGQAIITEAEGGEDGVSKVAAAKQFLLSLLAKGSVSAIFGEMEASKAGIRSATLRRAKKIVGVQALKSGGGHYRWHLLGESEN